MRRGLVRARTGRRKVTWQEGCNGSFESGWAGPKGGKSGANCTGSNGNEAFSFDSTVGTSQLNIACLSNLSQVPLGGISERKPSTHTELSGNCRKSRERAGSSAVAELPLPLCLLFLIVPNF